VDTDIKITGEFTPDPNVCRFVADRPVVKDWTLIFKSRDESMGSPLVDRLFDIPGVVLVRVSGSTVTVTKDVPTPWPEMGKAIGQAIRTSLSGDGPAISESALEAVRATPADDIESSIEQLLEMHINPALAMHGGFVRLVRVEDRDVYLEMGGGCQGCAASKATLRYGIENAIREAVPGVREIIDATDHAAGENPYYR
jgi:Fe-S cluster biogenesis protein NfuA